MGAIRGSGLTMLSILSFLLTKPQKLIVFGQNEHLYPHNESSYPSTLRDPRVFETNDPRGLANMQTERNPSNQGATIVV